MKKGILIAIYGINNIGKSTQAKELCKYLKKRGCEVKFLKYPIYNLKPSGPFINKILRNPKGQKISEDELQLWFVLNRYQMEPKLKKFLENGYIVVAEDYIGTGMAWGMTKGLSQEWVEYANKMLLKEDFSILLWGRRHEIAKEKTHVHEQNSALMAKSAEVHMLLAKKHGWKVVDANGTIEQTSKNVFKAVDDFMR